MRTAFVEELLALAAKNPRIFLLVGDLGFSVVEPFAEAFPHRYLNVGIAEQNMAGLAAGLASEGYHVFIYSIANFPTFRCAEQIRNDIAYHQLPVTIVSVGAGLMYGSLGYSHHAIQDLALMRLFPGMTLACPGSAAETRIALRALVQNPCPSYLRLGRDTAVPLPEDAPALAELNKTITYTRVDKDTKIILSIGGTLPIAMEAAGSIQGWKVSSLPLWDEGAKRFMVEIVSRHAEVIVAEDHGRTGGFGSFVQEALDVAPRLLERVRNFYISEVVVGTAGGQTKLNEQGGLSLSHLKRLMSQEPGDHHTL